VLAIEYSQDKRIFGVKADINEMSKFKSKLKKQPVVWDPEVEQKKADEANRKKHEEARK